MLAHLGLEQARFVVRDDAVAIRVRLGICLAKRRGDLGRVHADLARRLRGLGACTAERERRPRAERELVPDGEPRADDSIIGMIQARSLALT